jgi:alkylation response protein AidB-like acyl-CoA dehydrogenase
MAFPSEFKIDTQETCMTWIAIVLTLKIGVTGVLVALPLLLLRGARLSARLGVGVEAVPMARLYGVATTALLVGYASGFWAIAQDIFPWGVVAMGLASNGGAVATLMLTGAWQRNRFMVAFIAAITLALAAAAASPEWAMSRAF